MSFVSFVVKRPGLAWLERSVLEFGDAPKARRQNSPGQIPRQRDAALGILRPSWPHSEGVRARVQRPSWLLALLQSADLEPMRSQGGIPPCGICPGLDCQHAVGVRLQVARSLQIHRGYARRSRLACRENSWPRLASYFGYSTLARIIVGTRRTRCVGLVSNDMSSSGIPLEWGGLHPTLDLLAHG